MGLANLKLEVAFTDTSMCACILLLNVIPGLARGLLGLTRSWLQVGNTGAYVDKVNRLLGAVDDPGTPTRLPGCPPPSSAMSLTRCRIL
jgi:hypothetical protein